MEGEGSKAAGTAAISSEPGDTPQCGEKKSKRSSAVYIATAESYNPSHRRAPSALVGPETSLRSILKSSNAISSEKNFTLGPPHTPRPRQLQHGTILRVQPPPDYILPWDSTAPVSPHPSDIPLTDIHPEGSITTLAGPSSIARSQDSYSYSILCRRESVILCTGEAVTRTKGTGIHAPQSLRAAWVGPLPSTATPSSNLQQ